jgi:hypothetical protein
MSISSWHVARWLADANKSSTPSFTVRASSQVFWLEYQQATVHLPTAEWLFWYGMLSTEGGRTGMGRRIWPSFRTFTAGGGGGGAMGLRSVSGVVAALELVLMTVDGTGVWSDLGEPCDWKSETPSEYFISFLYEHAVIVIT